MLLSQNSKMRKTGADVNIRLFNFTLPALRSSTSLVTCPSAGVCAIGCYARMGAYRFSNVATKHESNLAASLLSHFVEGILHDIDKVKASHVRIHDSGDFYSREYLNKWLTIMQARPNVQFYAYTKQILLFKGLPLPINFTVIYSLGGKYDSLIDQARHRHSKVFESLEGLVAAGYADASSNDFVALGDNPKIGLVYHGNKSYSNTNWAKAA